MLHTKEIQSPEVGKNENNPTSRMPKKTCLNLMVGTKKHLKLPLFKSSSVSAQQLEFAKHDFSGMYIASQIRDGDLEDFSWNKRTKPILQHSQVMEN